MGERLKGDPTAMTFETYALLDLDERAEVLDAAYDHYEDTIEGLIARGAFWVMVCGPDCTVVQTADKMADVPVDSDIWELGKKLGYAPLHFFREDIVEDVAAA